MIGSIVEYNCGGSKSIALVIGVDKVDIPSYDSALASEGDILITVAWMSGKEELRPTRLFIRDGGTQNKRLADRLQGKTWYNAKWFQIASVA